MSFNDTPTKSKGEAIATDAAKAEAEPVVDAAASKKAIGTKKKKKKKTKKKKKKKKKKKTGEVCSCG